MLLTTVARSSSDGSAIRYVLCNGHKRPESKTTRTFRPVRQVSVPGAKSAVSDSVLFAVAVLTAVV